MMRCLTVWMGALLILASACTTARSAPPSSQSQTMKTVEMKGVAVQLDGCERVGPNTVRCYFTVTSKSQDKTANFRLSGRKGKETQIWDESGQGYPASSIEVGGESAEKTLLRLKLFADVPVKAIADFGNFSTQATKISRLQLSIAIGRPDKRDASCCELFLYSNVDVLN